MHSAPAFFTHLLGSLIRLALALMLGLLVAGFLLLGIGVALASVLWSLLRGKRPAMVAVFQTFRQASRQFRRGPPPPQRPVAPSDIVDVQAHELRAVPPSLPAPTEV